MNSYFVTSKCQNRYASHENAMSTVLVQGLFDLAQLSLELSGVSWTNPKNLWTLTYTEEAEKLWIPILWSRNAKKEMSIKKMQWVLVSRPFLPCPDKYGSLHSLSKKFQKIYGLTQRTAQKNLVNPILWPRIAEKFDVCHKNAMPIRYWAFVAMLGAYQSRSIKFQNIFWHNKKPKRLWITVS